jgi:hypothetical protein
MHSIEELNKIGGNLSVNTFNYCYQKNNDFRLLISEKNRKKNLNKKTVILLKFNILDILNIDKILFNNEYLEMDKISEKLKKNQNNFKLNKDTLILDKDIFNFAKDRYKNCGNGNIIIFYYITIGLRKIQGVCSIYTPL